MNYNMPGMGGMSGQSQMYMQNPYMTSVGGYNMPSMHAPQHGNILGQGRAGPANKLTPTKAEKLRVNLTSSERGTYSNLFDINCPRGSTEIDGPDAAAFLARSGLPKTTLKSIWSIAAQSNPRALNKEDFYIALRLVALAQAGKEVSEKAIRTNVGAPIPRFEGEMGSRGMNRAEDNAAKYTITNDEMQKYIAICNNVDTEQKGYLSTAEANLVLQKTHLPSNITSTLKMICDEQGTGRFPLATAVIMIHLGVLSKKVPLPKSIPADLRRRVESYVNSSAGQSFNMPGRRQPDNEFSTTVSRTSATSKTTTGAISSAVNDELVAAIRKELKDKRSEIADLKEEDNETKERLNHLKEQNKEFASHLQKLKEEVAAIKKSIATHKASIPTQSAINFNPPPQSFTPIQRPVLHSLIL
jgi:hypothetical protein